MGIGLPVELVELSRTEVVAIEGGDMGDRAADAGAALAKDLPGWISDFVDGFRAGWRAAWAD